RGTYIRLNPQLRPDSFLARTDPRDVARVESKTFICSALQQDAGPTNNWAEPALMRARLKNLFAGSMRGRTMYVIPFSMGPLGSPLSRLGVEITDSPYVASSMHIMTRVSSQVTDLIASGADWVPAVHSVGAPLAAGDTDSTWPCNPDDVTVTHFPETNEIWSYGSGYGGNSLLGKKAMALRIASVQGRRQGWLAEHMLLVKVTTPTGKVLHLAGAFPSACGKTNFAMLQPNLPGWKVETLGDDIVWMAPGSDGRLWAMNPENGMFGVAPGTSAKTNATAIRSMTRGVVFTNVALTQEGDVWWEDLTKTAPANLIDWRGNVWNPDSGQPAAHPNSRFCFPMENLESLSTEWDAASGVPLDAILFGGRRATNVPLVVQSRDWNHGVFMGATVSSEQTAAAEGEVGKLRRDPFAMLPFCGYNMADYFAHWLRIAGLNGSVNLPKIFQVNWFRKDADGKFLWPGFAENARVIQWIAGRLDGSLAGEDTAIGTIPAAGELNVAGLGLSSDQLDELLSVPKASWEAELEDMGAFLDTFGMRLPQELRDELAKTKGLLTH
ncbi:MAG: phosphoenolpyruvate carboxykinase (GTP), partial [Actinomycetales bacterium]|nr:phosphoenolpyruvate carboxykinase (GTP) [Actinomycetales bacterium]